MALSTHALSTVANAKGHLIGKDVVDAAHDTLIEFLINAYSDLIERHCGRHFEQATYTEKYVGHGRQWLQLRQRPVTVVTSVKDGGSVIPATDYELQGPEGRLFKENGWSGGVLENPSLSLREPHPYAVKFNLEAQYTAGYVLPQAGAGRTLPFDLELACIRLVIMEYKLRDKQGVPQETTEGLSVTIDKWPPDVVRILDGYADVDR